MTLTYNATSGHRHSYVYSESAYTPTFNGDYTQTSTYNELIYIPTELELEKMQFTTPADRNNYGQWIENNDYAREHRGQYAERNSSLTPWEHMLDLHFAQDFYYLKERGSKITLTFDILNLGNLIPLAHAVRSACHLLKQKPATKFGCRFLFLFMGYHFFVAQIK